MILCPICRDPGRPVPEDSPTFPFCGESCRDHDLAAWVRGTYRLPISDPEPAAERELDAEEGPGAS